MLLFAMAGIACPFTCLLGQQAVPPVDKVTYIGKDPFTGVVLGSSTSSNLDENRLRLIERTIDNLDADDTGRVITPQQVEERCNQRQTMIANDPDLSPYLIELANERIKSKNNGITQVFYAMSLRSDIDDAVVSDYIDKANTMMSEVSVNIHGNPGFEAGFLGGLTGMLKTYSPKGEDFLIKMIQTQDDPICKLRAANAIAKIGTMKSIPALLGACSWMSQQVKTGNLDKELAEIYLKEMNGSIEKLRSRIASGKDDLAKTVDTKKLNKDTAKQAPVISSIQNLDLTHGLWLFCLVVIIVILVSHWILKNRQK